jgi:AcrR family transcriptional regulator
VTTTVPSAPDAERPLRADAARNRQLVLDTARRLFAERGLAVTLNDIAHEAGIGVGTVYRRFADKDAVIAALMLSKFERLIELAREAERIADPREAMRTYLHGALAMRARDAGLSGIVGAQANHDDPAILACRAEMATHARRVLERAREAGVLHPGFGALDIPVLTRMIGAVADGSRDTDPTAWQRYAALVVDAVCPPEGAAFGELPGAEPEQRVVDGIVRR